MPQLSLGHAIAALLVAFFADSAGQPVTSPPSRRSLNVALYKYLPDASSAIERLEELFEAKYPSIDLDIELWDPYRNSIQDDGIDQMQRFDVVEIDTCRLDEMLAKPAWNLDALPKALKGKADRYIEPARAATTTRVGEFVAPHWICQNFLTIWSDNTLMSNAHSFDQIVAVVDPGVSRPLLIDLAGKSGLGEFYADAMLDLRGIDETKKHLQSLAQVPEDAPIELDPHAKARILALAKECDPKYHGDLGYFHDHSYVYPRDFANNHAAVLIGYSERLYYVEREIQTRPDKPPPCIAKGEIVVRNIPFSDRSLSTPTWIDGFCIPLGKCKEKEADICTFIQFAQSTEGFDAFATPAEYFAASNLLPALAAAYEGRAGDSQPCLASYRAAIDTTFPVLESSTWRGMRRAGLELEKLVK